MLRQTLDSIAAQTLLPDGLEVVISNDNSTDGTDALVAEYQGRLPSLRSFRQPSRLGGPGNWDFLLNQAKGEFVFLLCDDDAIAPKFLESYLTLLRDDPQLDMVFADIELRGPDFTPLSSVSLHSPEGVSDGRTRLRHQLKAQHQVMSTVYRRSLLIDAGRWDAQVGSHLDCTAFCRAALRARNTYRIPETLFQFRISAGSWSHKLATEDQGQLARWYRRKLDLLTEDARTLAPDLRDYIESMYLWHTRATLTYLEVEFAKGRLTGQALRRSMRAVLQVFPEGRIDRMTLKMLLVSVFGHRWLSALRRLTGRPNPYDSTLALFNSFTDT